MNTNIRYSSIQSGVDKTYFIIRGWTLTEDEAKKQNEVIEIKETDKDGKEVVVRTEYPGELYQKANGFYYDYENKAWIYHYPQEFVAPSEHDKYIIFQYCRCSVDDSIHGECEVHASFIPRDQYCDSLVYYANLQPPDDNRKYKVNTLTEQRFAVWFTDGMGKPWTERINFVIFLKLVY